MHTLQELGLKYGTTKADISTPANYLSFYELHLAPLRDKPITLLEIGVEYGNSLRMWREYFPQGKIIGMDCNDVNSYVSGERIETVTGNQGSLEDLDRVAEAYGPFDVIVDDAGHQPSLQIFCYKHMCKQVKPGGFYILEDLIGNHGIPFGPECTSSLVKLADSIIHRKLDHIETIAFSYGTSITKMRSAP